jgi:hypothetical protein
VGDIHIQVPQQQQQQQQWMKHVKVNSSSAAAVLPLSCHQFHLSVAGCLLGSSSE